MTFNPDTTQGEPRANHYLENLWTHAVRQAGDDEAGIRIDCDDEELSREHLVDLLQWVSFEHDGTRGVSSEYALVYHPSLHPVIGHLFDSRHWTGDSGTFDSGEVASFDEFEGMVRLRPDPDVYERWILIVNLDFVHLSGAIETLRYDETGQSTPHPFGAITGFTKPNISTEDLREMGFLPDEDHPYVAAEGEDSSDE